jgi:hypothetical protein
MCRLLITGTLQLLPPNPHTIHTTSAGTLITAALCPVLLKVPRDASLNLVDLFHKPFGLDWVAAVYCRPVPVIGDREPHDQCLK